MTISLTTSRAARGPYAAALCCDAKYLPYTLFVAEQLRRYSGIADLDILLVVPESCEIPASVDHLDLRICHIDANGAFDGLFLRDRLSESAYHRLALPKLMRHEYQRILYVDSDVFIHGGDFARLFAMELDGHPIAAVRDIQQWANPQTHVPQLSQLGLGPAKYFNSGVVLFDTAAFDDGNYLDQCIDFGRANKNLMTYQDQQLLNCVLMGNWKEISPIWNWQQPVRSPVFEAIVPVAIAHFIGRNKPWNDTLGTIAPRFILALRGFLRQHFPDHPDIDVPHTRDIPAAQLCKLSWKNLLRIPKLKRLMDRFPDDLGEG